MEYGYSLLPARPGYMPCQAKHLGMLVSGLYSDIHKVHTEWRLPISGLHPIMMEKSTLAGEGGHGGARTPPSIPRLLKSFKIPSHFNTLKGQ